MKYAQNIYTDKIYFTNGKNDFEIEVFNSII